MTGAADKLRFLLMQIRNSDDPIRHQEIGCFSRALACDPGRIELFDLLEGRSAASAIRRVDAVLIGGSGHYSVTSASPWLRKALESLRDLYELRKPTFASCWGFQALSRALGGSVIKDRNRAELGTGTAFLTAEGQLDPVFGPLGNAFQAQMGHEDCVVQLPPGATLLAASERANQALRFDDRPIYATQFHPELDLQRLLDRVAAYPEYVVRITGQTMDEFRRSCRETPGTMALLPRFVQHVF